MAHYAVMAIGADRPGILAAVTGALYGAGANLEDVSSTILRGHFASMLVVEAPEGLAREGLEAALREAVASLDVSVMVREAEAAGPPSQATHTLVAYAPDRPGIVARLSGLLAGKGVNVTDVSCRMVSEDRPVYTLVAELDVPAGVDPDALGADLRALGGELGVDLTFGPVEVETL
ncbi:MAG: ACT domain-containing protein [Actinobacteria bacterium]|nr:ACT domain-containing protein [Actinomycetota bacterium]